MIRTKLLRKGIRRFSDKAKPVEGVLDEQENGGYMRRRLQQLAEDAMPNRIDPKAGYIEDALPYNKVELHEKLDKISNDPKNFEYKHQQAIGIATLSSAASKHSRDIAMAKPWTGAETAHDASLRMLNDSKKPLKFKSTKTEFVISTNRLRTRIDNAKEGALDYKLAKLEAKDAKSKNNDDGWSEMYKEKLLGPSMLLNDSFASVDNSIKSLADQKIIEAQRRGEFNNITRGKPLDKGYHALENRFIDRTEYHLNSILKRQDALPPWIERQGGCDLQITRFRQELDAEWIGWAVNHIKDEFPGLDNDSLVLRMKEYAANEGENGKKLRSTRWMDTRRPFLETKVRDLNNTIRGYNLQAPLASQKLYLLLDKELNTCYKRSAPHLVEALQKHIFGKKLKEKEERVTVKQNSIPQRNNVYQQKSESLFSMFKKLF